MVVPLHVQLPKRQSTRLNQSLRHHRGVAPHHAIARPRSTVPHIQTLIWHSFSTRRQVRMHNVMTLADLSDLTVCTISAQVHGPRGTHLLHLVDGQESTFR